MSNGPKRIYLQIGDEADIKDLKESDFETNAITWCWERIFDNDIEYISKNELITLIDDTIKLYNANYYYENEIIDTLVNVKQKIESLK